MIGDAAAFAHQPGYDLLPGVSPVAIQQGHFVARTIGRELRGKRPAGRSTISTRASSRSSEEGYAVANLPRLRVSGYPAWLLWVFIHIFNLIGFRSRVLVMFEWAWSYFTFPAGPG